MRILSQDLDQDFGRGSELGSGAGLQRKMPQSQGDWLTHGRHSPERPVVSGGAETGGGGLSGSLEAADLNRGRQGSNGWDGCPLPCSKVLREIAENTGSLICRPWVYSIHGFDGFLERDVTLL